MDKTTKNVERMLKPLLEQRVGENAGVLGEIGEKLARHEAEMINLLDEANIIMDHLIDELLEEINNIEAAAEYVKAKGATELDKEIIGFREGQSDKRKCIQQLRNMKNAIVRRIMELEAEKTVLYRTADYLIHWR
ncbi:hypothetical protein GF373_17550 [bacterium]|nr:hypothetical protein [bacterium]